MGSDHWRIAYSRRLEFQLQLQIEKRGYISPSTEQLVQGRTSGSKDARSSPLGTWIWIFYFVELLNSTSELKGLTLILVFIGQKEDPFPWEVPVTDFEHAPIQLGEGSDEQDIHIAETSSESINFDLCLGVYYQKKNILTFGNWCAKAEGKEAGKK